MSRIKQKLQEKGAALIIVVVTMVVVIGFASASIIISDSALKASRHSSYKMKAQYAAQAGFEAILADMRDTYFRYKDFTKLDAYATDTYIPNNGFTILSGYVTDLTNPNPSPSYSTVTNINNISYNSLPVKTLSGSSMGKYRVWVFKTPNSVLTNPNGREFIITSIGTIDHKHKLIGTNPLDKKTNAKITARVQLTAGGFNTPSPFQFAYYIYHNAHVTGITNNAYTFNGNVGSRGAFDLQNSTIQVNGNMMFNAYDPITNSLSQQLPYTGGIISGGSIQNAQNVTGSPFQNYPNQPAHYLPPKPRITDSDIVVAEKDAYYKPFPLPSNPSVSSTSYIKVGTKYLSDGVYGDQQMPNISETYTLKDQALNAIPSGYTVGDVKPGTQNINQQMVQDLTSQSYTEISTGNLYLDGTTTPIEIHGNVVVKGNVIIKGKIQGQGTIIAMQNIYIAGNLEYVNPPDIIGMKQAIDKQSMEAWYSDPNNKNKDFVGLISKNSVGVGDWSNYINSSFANPKLNAQPSAEALYGDDGIPNTGDTGEGDTNWTTTLYTAQDQTNNLIPLYENGQPMYQVGDVVPGSGEDIDGNGYKNYNLNITDFYPLYRDSNNQDVYNSIDQYVFKKAIAGFVPNWGGNVPTPSNGYYFHMATQMTNDIKKIDSVIFANKGILGRINPTGAGITEWNGGLVSRVEALGILGILNFNFDRRVFAGQSHIGSASFYVGANSKLLSTYPIASVYEYSLQFGPDKP